MNEVIAIWKTNRGKDFYFSDPIKIGDSRIFFPKANHGESFEADFDCIPHLDLKYVRAIGKADINNKKIYADCSIVELEMYDEHGSAFYKGYFRQNEIGLNYEFIQPLQRMGEMEISAKHNYSLICHKICNIKIIDTIQENKLGLIK